MSPIEPEVTDGRPLVAWVDVGPRGCLKFTFAGQLTHEGALQGIADWRERLAQRPGGPVVLIWDCLAMRGYETAARVAWQRAMSEMKHRIDEIWLVSDSPLIRMGATVMNVLTSLRLHAVAAEKDIVLEGRAER